MKQKFEWIIPFLFFPLAAMIKEPEKMKSLRAIMQYDRPADIWRLVLPNGPKHIQPEHSQQLRLLRKMKKWEDDNKTSKKRYVKFWLEINARDVNKVLEFLENDKKSPPSTDLAVLYRTADYLLASEIANEFHKEIVKTILGCKPETFRAVCSAIYKKTRLSLVDQESQALLSYTTLPHSLESAVAQDVLAHLPIATIPIKRANAICFNKNGAAFITYKNGLNVQKRSIKGFKTVQEMRNLYPSRICNISKDKFTVASWHGKRINFHASKGKRNANQDFKTREVVRSITSIPNNPGLAILTLRLNCAYLMPRHAGKFLKMTYPAHIEWITLHPFLPIFATKHNQGLKITDLSAAPSTRSVALSQPNIKAIAFAPNRSGIYILYSDKIVSYRLHTDANDLSLNKEDDLSIKGIWRTDLITYHAAHALIAVSGLDRKMQPIAKVFKSNRPLEAKKLKLAACATALAFHPEKPLLWAANRKNIEVFNLMPSIDYAADNPLKKVYLKLHGEQKAKIARNANIDTELLRLYKNLSRELKTNNLPT